MVTQPLLHETTGVGDPIVLVPGGISGWRSWLEPARRLSGERQVIRVQLRSVELAEAGQRIPGAYGPTTERDALLATVDELGLERFALAGWSYGGHVALAFALEHPERVRTLTLIEPQASWLLRETNFDRESLDHLEQQDRSMDSGELTISDLESFLVRAGIAKPGDDPRSMPGWPIWERNRQALSIGGAIWDYSDSLSRLRTLDVPILAVRGTDSTSADTAIVGAIADNAPHTRLLELPGDHSCHLQNADWFLSELRAHLGEVAVR